LLVTAPLVVEVNAQSPIRTLRDLINAAKASPGKLNYASTGPGNAIARKAKLTREATYKMLSKSGNPELRSLTAVLEAAGLRIAVKPIEKQAA
jgi:hypothetical protein